MPAQSDKHEPKSKGINKNKPIIFIIIGSVLVVILAIVGISYYQSYVVPFNSTILTVDNVTIKMRYFLDRTRLAGSDPMSMLQTLTQEQIIKLVAPQYGIVVTDGDVDTELRNMAGEGINGVSNIEFKEWYRQKLNDLKVSNSLYRELLRLDLLTRRLQVYLAGKVPTVAEQVHLHDIAVRTYDEAQKVEDRLKAGEDFASVALEVSIDTASKEKGGDLGWLPPVLLPGYEEKISALAVNEMSDPLPFYSQTSSTYSNSGSTAPDAYYIFMVSEKDVARELDDTNLRNLQNRALGIWLPVEMQKHMIKYNFNSANYEWMIWQLQKSESSGSDGQ